MSAFVLEKRFMNDICLWRWDIRDATTGTLVRSSWDHEWTAYTSQAEAERMGRQACTRLIASSRPRSKAG
jgi:hypothetical protein